MMKGMLVMLVLVSMVAYGSETSLLPEMKLGSTRLRLQGFTTGFYVEDANKEVRWKDCWLVPSWQLSKNWRVYGELNFAYDDQTGLEENWMRVLRLDYYINDTWTFSAGRLSLSPISITPPPWIIETAGYPAKPMNIYGWGAQLSGKWGNWVIKTDVSGRSGVVFDQAENWDYPEWSGRVIRRLSDHWKIGATLQLSEEDQKVALDCRWQPVNQLVVRGAWFRASGENTDWNGAYGLAMYRPVSWLELQSQLNGWQSNGDHNLVCTNGVRLIGGADQIDLTLNYESVLDGERDDRLLARLRIRF